MSSNSVAPSMPGMILSKNGRYYNPSNYKNRPKRQYKPKRQYNRRYNAGKQFAKYKGKGGYFSDAWKRIKKAIPKGAFSKGGAWLGAALGGAPGAAIGGLAGKLMSKLTGFGDYKINYNSLMNPVDMGNQVPSFGDISNATRIVHREFIGNVVTPASPLVFTVVSYPVNASNSTTFPWLSGIAANYDKFRVRGMVFEFVSTFSDISSGGALGFVCGAADYDSADSNYGSDIQMEQAQYAISNKPSVSMCFPIECDPKLLVNPILFCNPSNTSVTGIQKNLYNHCNFQIATAGLPSSAGTILGKLYVTYDIELICPVLETGQVGGTCLTDHFTLPYAGISGTAAYFQAAATTTPLVPNVGSSIGGTCLGSTYTFPPSYTTGSYQVQYVVYGAASTLTTGMTMAGGLVNCTNLDILDGSTGSAFKVTAGATLCSSQIYVFCIQLNANVPSSQASITLTNGTLPGSISAADLIVTQLCDTVLT